jgi:hypothetical protein
LFLTLLFFDRTGKLIIDMKGYTSDYFSDGVARIYSSWIGTTVLVALLTKSLLFSKCLI